MKKFFILCCFVSSLAFGMENAKVMQSEADLSAILTHLSDRIYCIGETTRSQHEIKKELINAAEKIERYLDSHKELALNAKKESFFAAAIAGDAKIINIFLQAGCNINETNESGQTAAMGAAMAGNVSTLQALLDRGASIDIKSNDHLSIEQYASMIPEKMKSSDGWVKLGCITTIVSANARYQSGDPFKKCLELIQSQRKSTIYFSNNLIFIAIITALIMYGIYKSKIHGK